MNNNILDDDHDLPQEGVERVKRLEIVAADFQNFDSMNGFLPYFCLNGLLIKLIWQPITYTVISKYPCWFLPLFRIDSILNTVEGNTLLTFVDGIRPQLHTYAQKSSSMHLRNCRGNSIEDGPEGCHYFVKSFFHSRELNENGNVLGPSCSQTFKWLF